jgi:hypothetical protein
VTLPNAVKLYFPAFRRAPARRISGRSSPRHLSMTRAEEAQLLFSLLEAAEAEGRLNHLDTENKWRAFKPHYDTTHPERGHATLAALFAEVERSDVLVGTWIQSRWWKARMKGSTKRTLRRASGGGGSDKPSSS